jgi:integrase
MAILREFYDASKTDLVFSRSGNISPKFYRILREACKHAGVPYGRKNPNGLVLHDARHTATTHLLESNVSPKTVQEWMGWSDNACSLLLTRNETIQRGGGSIAGKACWRKNRVAHQLAKLTLPQTR